MVLRIGWRSKSSCSGEGEKGGYNRSLAGQRRYMRDGKGSVGLHLFESNTLCDASLGRGSILCGEVWLWTKHQTKAIV